MAKLLFVIAPKDFNDLELNDTREICETAGHTVDVASTTTGTAVGMMSHEEDVQLTLDDVIANRYDGLVIVGGYGAVTALWNNKDLHDLASAFNQQEKLTSAICVSPVVLAKAGLLAGKKATVWDMAESRDAFTEANVTYTEDAITQDGLLLTGKSPDAARDFGKAIVAHFARVTA
jgi:protease I